MCEYLVTDFLDNIFKYLNKIFLSIVKAWEKK